ncbi:hypothetical protein LshimejAT787_1900160 [Lyophyllum shimeji]|uniref:Uncharacterized protein n=1 Tax=Lyophyllum shimeji TaxID=47721 RepID=A0A9P3PZN3_LYOSH|nr:hypothetical protein LshimejAT787_1900160 [Lyophyllum shimeji]
MKLTLSALSVLVLLTSVSASGTPLTQAQAEARLIPNDITAYSSGMCTDRTKPNCTSYQGILSGTVDGVITLKNAAGVPSLVITGGTEVGHASSTYSHANGYKVDTVSRSGKRQAEIFIATRALTGISRTSKSKRRTLCRRRRGHEQLN